MASKTTKPTDEAANKNGGRPKGGVNWAENWKEELCMRLIEGMSLRQITKRQDMPSETTVLSELRLDAEFQGHYARAREAQAEAEFEEILRLADEVEPTHEAIAKAKLQIDARKWRLAKLAPKKYGNKVEVDTDGDASAFAKAIALVGRQSRQIGRQVKDVEPVEDGE